MIIVTGGAGFIGSALVWQLNRQGEKNIVIVDRLGKTNKWRNLAGLQYNDYLDKDQFISDLEIGKFGDKIKAIFHMGACSSTTENDADYLVENNYRYTVRLGQWHENHQKCRLVYASSAATYGDGRQGYSDDENSLASLKPLNMYGYSKHMFDLYAKRKGWFSDIVGLKFFNVFGPNEGHKDSMGSVIHKAYPGVRDSGNISLFKSYRDDYGDGEQSRDFIYIKDVVTMILFFMDNPDINGIYNVGSGIAHTWNEVAGAMFKAIGKKGKISYIKMPENLVEKYQYHTCADMKKLIKAGCDHTGFTLENAINDYVCNYLACNATISDT